MPRFDSFPSTVFTYEFRENINELLQWLPIENYLLFASMRVWRSSLVHGNQIIPLYTIEEFSASSPRTPLCDLCRSSGWGDHFISKQKYHFIIPADKEWLNPLKNDVLDDQSHVFHGLIHCNGFGHIICINGKEAGSHILCGREIMDLWDRICISLGARKITVEDVSKKRGMDVKLLHEIAYGHSWFGRWGYKFIGSFETSQKYYDWAVEDLSSIQIDKIPDCAKFKQIIDHYRHVSEGRLMTMRDLLRYILTTRSANHVNPSQTKCPPAVKNFNGVAAKIICPWPQPRLEETAEAIVDILKQKKEGAASYEELTDALSGGDTGLLCCVLSLMDDVVVGNYLVSCATIDDTSKGEYSITEIQGPDRPKYYDVQLVYNTILTTFLLAPKVVIQSKIFIKEWPVKEHGHRFICQVKLSDCQDESSRRLQQTGEVVVVIPPSSTIGDLKRVAQMAIRDTYRDLSQFVVTEIEGMEDKTDEETISWASQVAIRGLGGGLAFEAVEHGEELLVCSYCDKTVQCIMANGGAVYCNKCYDSR